MATIVSTERLTFGTGDPDVIVGNAKTNQILGGTATT
jgi:hypothetical protein